MGSYAFFDCKQYKTIELPAGQYAMGECSYGFVKDSNGGAVKNDGVKFICVPDSPSKTYAVENGFAYVGIGEAKYDIITGKNARMLCDFANGYVVIDAGKSLSDISDMFKAVKVQSLLSADGNKIDAGDVLVITGMKLSLEEKGKYLDIAVRGDVDSNGLISASDARTALRIASKLDNAVKIRVRAADVDFSDSVTASDARSILRVSAKIDSIW